MFTGLVEATGAVLSIEKSKKQEMSSDSLSTGTNSNTYARMRIGSPHIVRSGVAIGDSLCVNGTCLTVVRQSSRIQRLSSLFTKKPQNIWFEVEMLAATLEKTSMHALKVHDRVNLERAMRASQRMGGHFVTGHIACVGTIESLIEDGENYFLTVQIPEQYMKYMIREGSVALDGISLTIAKVSHTSITCNIIPHTREVTNLRESTEGDKINVEPDIIARYVENMVYSNENRTAIDTTCVQVKCNIA